MATNEVTVKLDAEELIAQLKAAQEALSEARIRAIVLEEIEAHEKRQLASIRAQGLPTGYWPEYEVKYDEHP